MCGVFFKMQTQLKWECKSVNLEKQVTFIVLTCKCNTVLPTDGSQLLNNSHTFSGMV